MSGRTHSPGRTSVEIVESVLLRVTSCGNISGFTPARDLTNVTDATDALHRYVHTDVHPATPAEPQSAPTPIPCPTHGGEAIQM